jgi:SAM-dependent methyltransferase
MLQAHTFAWYERLSEEQKGYYYPWHSILQKNHGEDSYREILQNELTTNDVVLDAGCGSGELTNEIAQWCKHIYGYDCVKNFIDIANKNRNENATFIIHESKQNGIPKINHDGIDYFISSKGPANWIADSRRVARPDAKMIMLMPYTEIHEKWNSLLPMELKRTGMQKKEIIESIEIRLKSINCTIDDILEYETDEVFTDHLEFLKYLVWGKFNYQYDERRLLSIIDQIFANYGSNNTLSAKYASSTETMGELGFG